MQAVPTPHPKWKFVKVTIEPIVEDPDYPEDTPSFPSVVAWYTHPSDAVLRKVPRATVYTARNARNKVKDRFAREAGWSYYFKIHPVGSRFSG